MYASKKRGYDSSSLGKSHAQGEPILPARRLLVEEKIVIDNIDKHFF